MFVEMFDGGVYTLDRRLTESEERTFGCRPFLCAKYQTQIQTPYP